MLEIYRRYSPTPPQQFQNRNFASSAQPDKKESLSGSVPHRQTHRQHRIAKPKPPFSRQSGVLESLLPPSLYNPKTKKIFGVLKAEDLLLVALIFLFLEDSSEDNPLLALALIYVLVSDYIDLGEFGF